MSAEDSDQGPVGPGTGEDGPAFGDGEPAPGDGNTDQGEAEEGVQLPPLDPRGQLRALLDAPDRDRCPGVRPVVSVDAEDDPNFISEVNERCVAAPRLIRRGAFHGDWAELHDQDGFFPRDPLPALAERWEEARPIILHDVLDDDLLDSVVTDRWLDGLRERGGLAAFLKERTADLAPEYRVQGPRRPAVADERDVEGATISWRAPKGRPTRGPGAIDDLWAKTQRLSTHPDDHSLRLRLSFGDEIEADASRDMARHRAVSELANRLLPEVAALNADRELTGLVAEWIRGKPLLTQAIAYWNAPNGGARFHHDAFDEPTGGRQRGVLYAQLTGATAWVALSTDDLLRRALEFAELLQEGEFPWVREHIAPGAGDLESWLDLLHDPERARRVLGAPGGGALGPLIDQGPEFTSLLADAGHGFVVTAGDVILLPNHGLEQTCMHSVFCASDEEAFSLSLAIRQQERASVSGGRKGSARRRGSRPRGNSRGGGRRGGRGSRPGSSRRR